jgi:hypothetical protein
VCESAEAGRHTLSVQELSHRRAREAARPPVEPDPPRSPSEAGPSLRDALTPNRIPAVGLGALAAAAGLLVVAIADNLARTSSTGARPLFWAGYMAIVLPIAALVLFSRLTRRELMWLMLALGAVLYLVKVMHSPLWFTFHDELGHLRTAADIQQTGHLFEHNPILRASPFFPALETVTTALAGLSGLSLFVSGLVVIGVARLITIVALFRLYEFVMPPRAAALATIVYASNPTFLYFDGQFSYESLALALAPIVLLGILRLAPGAGIVLGSTLAVGVIVTHHLTSYALCAFLAVWALLVVVARRRSEEARAVTIAAVAAIAIAVAVVWALLVAPVTSGYITPVVRNAVHALADVASGGSSVKHPFQGAGGYGRPAWERIVSLASVAIVSLGVLVGLVAAIRRRPSALGWALALTGAAYPLTLLPRLTQAGTEISNRSSGFVFVGVGYLVALILVRAVPAPVHRRVHQVGWGLGSLAVLAVLFIGGVGIGWAPAALQPGPFIPAANSRSIDPLSRWAAIWARNHLRPDSRLSGDVDSSLLMAAYAGQDPQSGTISSTPVSRLFTATRLGPVERRIIVADQLRYLVVDRRISDALPGIGFYFAPGEPGAFRHSHPIPDAAVEKFHRAPYLDEVFSDGRISIYDTRKLLRGGR